MLLFFSMDNFEGVLCYPAVVSTVESDPTSLNSNTSSHLHIFLFSAGWKLWRYFEMVFSLFMIFVSCLLGSNWNLEWSPSMESLLVGSWTSDVPFLSIVLSFKLFCFLALGKQLLNSGNAQSHMCACTKGTNNTECMSICNWDIFLG